MTRALRIQTVGSLIVLGAFIASEASARLLSARPDWAFAWYLNLEWFRPFEYARIQASSVRLLFGVWSLPVAVLFVGLTWLAWRCRFRFGVALIANLCFVFVAGLAFAWTAGGTMGRQTASLVPIGAWSTSDVALVGVMLSASCLGFLASHASFFAAISRERRGNGAGPIRSRP